MILLDTHVVVWWFQGGRSISARARRQVDRSDILLVSPLTCWEIGQLSALGRIRLDRTVLAWVDDLTSEDRVRVAELTPAAAASAALLPNDFPSDPVDRLLYATARDLGVPFVTKDARIAEYAAEARDVRVVW